MKGKSQLPAGIGATQLGAVIPSKISGSCPEFFDASWASLRLHDQGAAKKNISITGIRIVRLVQVLTDS